MFWRHREVDTVLESESAENNRRKLINRSGRNNQFKWFFYLFLQMDLENTLLGKKPFFK